MEENQRRGGRPGQLLCSWKARGQPFPKWVEKFAWTQGPFCSVFVSQSGRRCVRQRFRTEWEAGKLRSPKVDVVFVLQRGKLRNRKNKMKYIVNKTQKKKDFFLNYKESCKLNKLTNESLLMQSLHEIF